MTTPETPPWKSLLVDILYGTQLPERASDRMVDKLAQELVTRRYFSYPPAAYYEAVQHALASNNPLAYDQDQSENAVKDFFERLLVRLDEMRPWPIPAIAKMNMDTWPDFIRTASVIGYLAMSAREAQRELYAPFIAVPDDEQHRKARLFTLRTGEIIALRTTPAGGEPRLELLAHRDSATALDDFRALTTFDPQPADVDAGDPTSSPSAR